MRSGCSQSAFVQLRLVCKLQLFRAVWLTNVFHTLDASTLEYRKVGLPLSGNLDNADHFHCLTFGQCQAV